MPSEVENATDPVVVGRIQGAFGIRGWIRLISYTEPPANILDYDAWLLQQGSAWEPCERLAVREQGSGFVAKLKGIDDRDAAGAMKGRLLAVAPSALPEPAEDEFYWRDLVGLQVYGAAGQHIGSVRDMMATGANDVLIVALAGGGQELIPFHRQYVPEVDLAGGKLTVDWEIEGDA
jgi:16S rRNA processing protein RimM